MNGKLVVGAGRSDLARLLAVAPDSAQIVVLRKGESLAALRTLRSDNLRLTHRIGYLEEQVRDLLAPSRTEVPADPPPSCQEHVQARILWHRLAKRISILDCEINNNSDNNRTVSKRALQQLLNLMLYLFNSEKV